MITLKFPISLSNEEVEFIKSYQTIQSSMIRYAYNRAKDGLKEIEVRKHIKELFSGKLDSWFQQSAIVSGIGMYSSDKETGRKSRIFGGKSNFIRRTKNLISSDEWKEYRLLPLTIIGQSPAKGNRKFDFYDNHVVFKPFKGYKIDIILPRMRNNWNKLWKQAVILTEEKKIPISVSLTSTEICITFDDKKCKEELTSIKSPIKSRYAGIDMNPNYIGVSVFDSGKMIDAKLFSIKELTGKNISENKLEYETIETSHAIGRWLQHLQVNYVFIEKLSFQQGNKGLGKNFNRLCQNQWKKTKFKSALSKYYKLYEVNAAYSSTIGNILTSYPDPIAASTEVARRGFELVVKKSKKFYPELPTLRDLEDRWKKTDFPVFNSWKELHDFLKNSGLKYRISLPLAEFFRKLKSSKSQVSVYNLDKSIYT